MLNRFRLDIIKALARETPISFRDYVKNQPVVEKVRSFILLLFVATEGLVQLIQENEDILVIETGKELV